MTREKIMYGTHALQATVTLPDGSSHQQWYCGKCNTIWGSKGKHMASWCCCTHMICACGKEHEKGWTCCDSCRANKSAEKWYAKPEVIWDGEWPIATDDSDRYFFDESALIDHIQSVFDEATPINDITESLRLTSCSPNKPPYFEINDWCCDVLGEDSDGVADSKSIDDRINAIIGEIGIVSFSANSDRLNVRDVLDRIGFMMEDLE